MMLSPMFFDELWVALTTEPLQDYLQYLSQELGLNMNVSAVFGLHTRFEAAKRPARIPLSFSQERLWFINRLQGSVFHHVPLDFIIKGSLNADALSTALREVVNRHELLRTVIIEEDGTSFQQIKDLNEWQLEFIDGSKYDAAELEKCIKNLVDHPFDLSKDHMLRAHLIRINEDEHRLIVTIHQVALGNWSLFVLTKEYFAYYHAIISGTALKLPAITIQYADYAVWQRNFLKGEILDQKLAYWKNKLSGLTQLVLPADHNRPVMQTTKAGKCTFSIDKNLFDKLNVLSKEYNKPLSTTLFAIFNILLNRYSDQEDICVGTHIHPRKEQHSKSIYGSFIHLVPVRTQLDTTSSFTELLSDISATFEELTDYQEVPFEKIIETCCSDRDLSRHPLFQVLFTLQPALDLPVYRCDEVSIKRIPYQHLYTPFDLQFSLSEKPDSIDGAVLFATDVFKEDSVQRMIQHFLELVNSVVNSPFLPVAKLKMLSEDELEHLLIRKNDTTCAYDKKKTIIDFFEAQVLLTPGAIAINGIDKQITYRQLDEQSNKLAHYLRSKGVREKDMVPVCMQRNTEMIVSMIGILKSGAAYVPVDPAYPAERIKYILHDVGADHIVSNSMISSIIGATTNCNVIEIDKEYEQINIQPSSAPVRNISTSELAYVIYTSGSTGKPKGVMIEHKSVSAFIQWCHQEFSNSRFDIVYATTSICFDLSVYEIFFPLTIGKPIRLLENGLLIKDYLQRDNQILINSVPSVILALIKEGVDLSNVSVLNMAGEPIPLQVQQSLDMKSIEVRNLYGPTEDTTYSTICRLKQGEVATIGKPISNSQVYILNKSLELTAPGVAGEICIAGDGLARGYLHRPDLTAEKFVANPFSREATGRMYKTGDIGKWLANGEIEYLGRLDEQVKVRGFRIELGEIENVMQELDEITTAVVLAKDDKEHGKKLVAYYTASWKVIKSKEREVYQRQVINWKELYEAEYQQKEEQPVDPEFNIVGWKDSFTAQPIGPSEMREWLRDIRDIILSGKPSCVLEIGCGTGLIYYSLAGSIKKYYGADFSKASIKQIEERIKHNPQSYCETELFVAAAHEIGLRKAAEVDTIVINSVVQYFPGQEYMGDVIQTCMSILNGQGRIIIGDVRDNRLVDLFSSRLQLQKCRPQQSIKEFSWAVDQDILKEEELCFSPEYFYSLQSLYPLITHVEIKWKQGDYNNELSLYRYDVILHVGDEEDIIQPSWQVWKGAADKHNILSKIEAGLPLITFSHMPNPRLWRERAIAKCLRDTSTNSAADLLAACAEKDSETRAVEAIIKAAMINGYSCSFLIDRDPLKMNLLLEKEQRSKHVKNCYTDHSASRNTYTNIPLFVAINAALQKDIRACLKERLPEYMVPSQLIPLHRIPMTDNGKIDRRFLNQRTDNLLINSFNYQPPANETETRLVKIWQELLHLERVGVNDNFFELGGHSMVALRLIS